MFGKTDAQKEDEKRQENAREKAFRVQRYREDNQAFPSMRGQYSYWEGMTRREYFAALAMQGMVAGPERPDPADIAEYAVRVADALLAALKARATKEGEK